MYDSDTVSVCEILLSLWTSKISFHVVPFSLVRSILKYFNISDDDELSFNWFVEYLKKKKKNKSDL